MGTYNFIPGILGRITCLPDSFAYISAREGGGKSEFPVYTWGVFVLPYMVSLLLMVCNLIQICRNWRGRPESVAC